MSVTVFIVISVAVGWSAPIPKGEGQRSFFPTTIGTKWVFMSNRLDRWEEFELEIQDVKQKDGVTTLTIVDNTVKSPMDPRNIWYVISESQKGISVVREASFNYERPIELLRLPAKIGDHWKFDTHYRTVGGLTACPKDGRMKVAAIETVKTPAGEFESVRVEGVGGGTGRWTETYWFARGVGLVKWVSNARDEYALKSFKLPR
jgi:hypothetical protein